MKQNKAERIMVAMGATETINTIEGMIGRYSNLSAAERMNLGNEIISAARSSLRVELERLQSETLSIQSLLGVEKASVVPSVPAKGIKSGSNSDKVLDTIRKNPGLKASEIAAKAGLKFTPSTILNSLVESKAITKSEDRTFKVA